MSHRIFRPFASLVFALMVMLGRVTPALAAPPLNDDFADAMAISLPFSASADISEASTELDEPQFCWFMDRTIWYSFSPAHTQVVRMDTVGSAISSNVNVYRLDGSGFGNLSFLECADFGNQRTFLAEAGEVYYFQVGSPFGDLGNIQLNLEEVPPPANDDFANAITITSLPFDDSADTIAATNEAGEPTPSCGNEGKRTVWYAFTPSTSGPVSASFNFASFSPVTTAYTGNSLASLTEVGCRAFGDVLTIQADANTTYYFQVSAFFDEGGSIGFHLEVTPPPVADFSFSPSDPSVLNVAQFCDNSSDPGQVGFQSFTWDFGDGATSTDNCASHQYAADGDYTVGHSVTTFDGRTASTSRVVQVRTHDVSIRRVAAPKSASVGQTRAINVYVRNTRYPETVRIEFYRSVPGGFELVGVSTQFVPVRAGNRTSLFTFNYTFTPQDAQIGKVTFRAVVIIENANDAFPADNDAISTPPTVVKR